MLITLIVSAEYVVDRGRVIAYSAMMQSCGDPEGGTKAKPSIVLQIELIGNPTSKLHKLRKSGT